MNNNPPVNDTLSTFRRWLADNHSWIGIFENKDLGHPDCGNRIALVFDQMQSSFAEIGKTRAPDTNSQTGWRYVLIAKCHTAEEALAVLEGADWPLIEQSQIKQSDDKV